MHHTELRMRGLSAEVFYSSEACNLWTRRSEKLEVDNLNREMKSFYQYLSMLNLFIISHSKNCLL